jgi:hypothetical protein
MLQGIINPNFLQKITQRERERERERERGYLFAISQVLVACWRSVQAADLMQYSSTLNLKYSSGIHEWFYSSFLSNSIYNKINAKIMIFFSWIICRISIIFQPYSSNIDVAFRSHVDIIKSNIWKYTKWNLLKY